MTNRARTITQSTVIFNAANEDDVCSKFHISCNPDSADGVNVFVKGLHNSDSGFPLYVGDYQVFEAEESISKVTVEPVGASAIIDYGIIAK